MIYVKQEIGNLTYSNIVSTVPDYVPTTNYLLGDLVRVGSYHYKSLYGTVALPNVGKDPLSNLGTAWFEYEVSNTYACLDTYIETKTTWTGDGIVEFTRNTKDKIGIGNFNATKLTIEYRDDLGNVIGTPTVYNFLNKNRGRNSPWTYYSTKFQQDTSNTIYVPILRKGTKIRIIFERDGLSNYCGFIVSGKAEDMGKTLENVSFPDKRIGNRTVSVADFQTAVEKRLLMKKIEDAKKLINTSMMFAIDESENSYHQNMIILGKITKCDGAANNFDKNIISWQIEQNIIT